MPQIDGQHRKAEGQSRCADQQIDGWNHDTRGRLFPVDAPSQHRRFRGIRIDRNCNAKLFDEGLTPKPSLRRICTVDAMYNFRQADRRKGSFLIAGQQNDVLDELLRVSPRRSAAITTLESRISPMQEGSAARGGR